MSLVVALADAANNAAKEGATTVLTLRNGVQLVGRLKREQTGFHVGGTAHMSTEDGNGWVTVLIEEIAAVQSRRY